MRREGRLDTRGKCLFVRHDVQGSVLRWLELGVTPEDGLLLVDDKGRRGEALG